MLTSSSSSPPCPPHATSPTGPRPSDSFPENTSDSLYCTDGHYVTPPPRTAVDRQLWRLVISLYVYDSEEALRRAGAAASTTRVASAETSSTPRSAGTGSSNSGSPSKTASGAHGGTAEADKIPVGDLSVMVAHVVHRLEKALSTAQCQQQAHSAQSQKTLREQRGTSSAAAGGFPNGDVPMPFGDTGGTRSCSSDNREGHKLSGSVFDLVLQHPFPPLRRALLECLLNHLELFSFAMCAPFAVCAAVGDVHALRLLLVYGEDSMDPNSGFPLTVAVRHNQLAVLTELLGVGAGQSGSTPRSSPRSSSRRWRGSNTLVSTSPTTSSILTRLKPNYGNPFAEAVRTGNLAAAALLAAHEGVNVNRFANNRGTNPLLCACRGFIDATRRVTALETALSQRAVGGGGGAAVGPFVKPLAAPAKRRGVNEAGEDDGVGSGSSSSLGLPRHNGGGVPVRRKPLSPNVSGSPVPTGGTAALAATATPAAPPCFFKRQLTEALDQQAMWREMVCLLLSHPDIDVNMGYYSAPLQIATQHSCPELVELLLLHPSIKPNRAPKPTSGLAQSLFTLQHDTIPHEALLHIVDTPLEVAVRNRSLEVFALLARHPRSTVSVGLHEELERDPRDFTRVPFLEVLAQCKPGGWEGWGWKWRRRCVYGAALSGVALCVLNCVLMVEYPKNTSSLCWFLLFTYCTALVPTVFCSAFRRYRVPEGLPAALAHLDGSAEVSAAVARRLASLPLAAPGPTTANPATPVSVAATPSSRVGGRLDSRGYTPSAVTSSPTNQRQAAVATSSSSGAGAGTGGGPRAPAAPPSLSSASPLRQTGVGVALVRVVLSTSDTCRRFCCCCFWAVCGGTGPGKARGTDIVVVGSADDVTSVGVAVAAAGATSGTAAATAVPVSVNAHDEAAVLQGSAVVGTTVSSVLALLLLVIPILPLMELVVVWVFAVYLRGDGASGARGDVLLDSPEALSHFLRRTFSSPGRVSGGGAERAGLVNDSDAEELVGPSQPSAPGKAHASLSEPIVSDDEGNEDAAHEALVEEAGRKVFLHDGDGIGDKFPFHQEQLRRQRERREQQPQRHGAALAPSPSAPVLVVEGGVGSERLRAGSPLPLRRGASGSFSNESFSYPRPAAANNVAMARRRALEEGPSSNRSSVSRRDGKPAAVLVQTTQPSLVSFTKGPPHVPQVTPPPRGQEHCSAYLQACARSRAKAARDVTTTEGPNLYVRSLAYLSLELLAPSRLAIALMSLFTHLITLFPETHDGPGEEPPDGHPATTNTGASVVAAFGLIFSVMSIAVYMTMWLALRRTSPQSLLSGRRNFYEEGSMPGPMEEYLL